MMEDAIYGSLQLFTDMMMMVDRSRNDDAWVLKDKQNRYKINLDSFIFSILITIFKTNK